jgi:aryl-alcohol dehydrogenase
VLLPFPLPGVLGHEGAGVVREVGDAVTDLHVGDRVIMSQMFCNTCAPCAAGDVTDCEQGFTLGLGGRRANGSALLRDKRGNEVGGGFLGQSSFASYALARAVNVFKVADDIPWQVAAPLGCGVQTGMGMVLNVLQPKPGSSIAIFGAGTVGLSALLGAVHRQCETIIMADLNPSRLSMAKDLGATHVIDVSTHDPVEAVRDLTGGGVMFSVEASGALPAGPAAVHSLGRKGVCALAGAPPMGSVLSVDWIFMVSSHTITSAPFGGGHPRREIARLTDLYRAGKLPIERFIRTYPLSEINDAITAMQSGDVIKPVLLNNVGNGRTHGID